LLERLKESLKDYIGQESVALQISNTTHEDAMLGNENALRGALMNVLNNAVDALGETGSQGRIDICVSQPDDRRVKIVIKDNGPGLTKKHCQRIFEPFFTTKTNGTGLGLAVVDSVVKAHGGQVYVSSVSGAGATFTFILPCVMQTPQLLPGGFSGKNLNQESQHETV